MRKLTALLLTVIVILALFAGCNESKDDIYDTHVHSYGEWTILQEPTCAETGIRGRTCGNCGVTETEIMPVTEHSYVDGVCSACGEVHYSGEFRVIDGLEVDSVYHSSDKIIVFQKGDNFYVADRAGNVLTAGYNGGIKCVSSDGYVVAYNRSTEVISTEEDEYFGTLETVRYVDDYDVIDENGEVVFSRQYVFVSAQLGTTTYEGECILSCNEGRIITATSDTYYFATPFSPSTVNIYDMAGNRLAQFTDVRDVGTMINGELIMLMGYSSEITVVDKDGNILRSASIDDLMLYCGFTFFPGDIWTNNGFSDGYVLLSDERESAYTSTVALVGSDLSVYYVIDSSYLAERSHIGTIVASKIVLDGAVSEEYYLVDLAKCATDENGYCIPTLDAAVSQTGYGSIYISALFGEYEQYVLVERDGRWGYLKADGSAEVMYDDAGSFFDGIAIVLDGDGVYVIDESFERVSDILTGYTGVAACRGGVFMLSAGGRSVLALFD